MKLPKHYLKKYLQWDDHTIKELILEEWNLVSQYFSNRKYQSISQRVKDIIASDNNIVRY